MGPADMSNLSRLRTSLNQYFDRGELREICFDLGIDHDGLPGESKSDLVREMVIECARRGRLKALASQCRQRRPAVQWPDIPQEEINELLRSPKEPAEAPVAALSRPELKERQKQLILLAKVRRFWIDGVLENSTAGGELIGLHQMRADDAVENPWHEVTGTVVYDDPSLSAGRDILDSFRESNQALLILGGPGSGKTTALLKLTKSLVELAERDNLRPIPVVLNLSSWEEKKQRLDQWVEQELAAKYQIPVQTGRSWLANDDLLLLLDGLDEVSVSSRDDCVRALNRFRGDHGLTGLAVCSRIRAYEETGVQLRMGGAIVLQRLSAEQVDEYLAAAGPGLAALRAAIEADETLAEMAQSPLMLNVMRTAYRDLEGEPPLDLKTPGGSLAQHRRRLFGAYVRRVLRRRGATDYSPDQTKGWLAWLAERMNEHNQAVFLIEQLQPSWLPRSGWQRLYVIGSRLLGGLIIAGLIWLMFAPASSSVTLLGPGNESFLMGFGALLILNIILGLVVGFIDLAYFETRFRKGDEGRLDYRQGWQHLAVVALVVGLSSLILLQPSNDQFDGMAMFGALLEAVFFVLGFGYVGHGQSYRTEIRTAIGLSWSWRGALMGAGLGLLLGLGIVLINSDLAVTAAAEDAPTRIRRMVAAGFFLFFILFGGLGRNHLETTSRPNQGIWLSLRNGLLAAALFGLTMGLAIGLLATTVWPENQLLFGLRIGVIFAIATGLLYGFIDVMKHLGVRLLLRLNRLIPWQYARFLDQAAGMVLLHKVGGGYIFIHRLLQDFFAAGSGELLANENQEFRETSQD